jgi:hypothetical protein
MSLVEATDRPHPSPVVAKVLREIRCSLLLLIVQHVRKAICRNKNLCICEVLVGVVCSVEPKLKMPISLSLVLELYFFVF